MTSHISDSRPSSSAGRTSPRRKSHSSPPRPEPKLSSPKHSSSRNSQPGSSIRRPHSTGNATIRSDGSWMAPEVLAWKRPHRSPRVPRAPVVPERQANRCNTFDAVNKSPTLPDQKRPARRKGSDCSGCGTGAGTHRVSKRPDAPLDQIRPDISHKVPERRARSEVPCDIRHQYSVPGALGVDRNVPRPQSQGHRPRHDKLATLSKDFQSHLVNPMPNRCVHPGEEGMTSSFASKKVIHWLKPSRNKTERPRTASLTQALRFTALLAQVPLADAGLDEKIIPSRYNPQSRTSQGSRFVGC